MFNIFDWISIVILISERIDVFMAVQIRQKNEAKKKKKTTTTTELKSYRRKEKKKRK